MCNFFSALGLRDGSIRWHWAIDSHHELLEHFDMSDTSDYQLRFCKLELTPPDDDSWLEPDKWTFKIDDMTAPVWCDEDRIASFKAAMVAVVKSMVVTKGVLNRVYDRCLILGGDAQVRNLCGGSRVKCVRGSAKISGVWDSAQISDVRGSAKISGVWGSAKISGVWGSAKISGVRGSAKISGVGPNVSIDDQSKKCVVAN